MPARDPAVRIEELLAHTGWVRGLARSLVADPNLADDVEQQTWVAALERPPRERSNPRAWLGRVLRNRLFDHRRGETRRDRRENAVRRSRQAPSQDELLIQAETRARVAQAVLALDEPYRSTILLRYFEDVPPRRIAETHGVSVSTVHTRIGRALGRLRSDLRERDTRWRAALLPLAGWNALPTGSLIMSTAATRVSLALGGLLLLIGVAFLGAEFLRDDEAPLDPEVESARVERDTPTGPPRLEGSGVPEAAPHEIPQPTGRVVEGARAPAGVVEGRVQDERGRPLPRADVLLLDEHGQRIVARMGTDAEGRFRFEQLPDATYRLAVHSRGGQHAMHVVRPGGPMLLVTLDVAAVPVVAASERVVTGDPVAPGVVAGTVRDDEGRPLEAALVLLVQGPSTVARVETDEHGTFRFEGLADAPFALSVFLSGWARLQHPVEPGGHELDIRLERGPSLGGVVVDEKSGHPVAGLLIAALAAEGGAPVVQTETAEDGTFRLGGLSAGTSFLDLGLRYGAPAGPSREYVWKRAGPFEAGALDLRLEVRRGLVIAGTIRAPDGSPWTEGARVGVDPITEDGRVDYDGRRSAPANADGTFEVPGLPPGRYDVTVKPEGGGSLAHLERISAGTLDLIVDLVGGTPLEGRLVDETGEAVEGEGWVWVSPPGTPLGAPGSIAAEILDEGRFRTTPLDPGRAYHVNAIGFDGYQAGEVRGVHPGNTDIVVTLKRGVRIEGRVVLANGQPAPRGVPVRARAADGGYAHVVTSATGGFMLGGLEAGVAYALKAGGGGSGLVSTSPGPTVKAPAGDVKLTVVKGVVLAGQLVDENGDALAAVNLQARPAGGGSWSWARTDAEGKFRFAGVVPGKVTLGATLHDEFKLLGTYEAPAEDLKLTFER